MWELLASTAVLRDRGGRSSGEIFEIVVQSATGDHKIHAAQRRMQRSLSTAILQVAKVSTAFQSTDKRAHDGDMTILCRSMERGRAAVISQFR